MNLPTSLRGARAVNLAALLLFLALPCNAAPAPAAAPGEPVKLVVVVSIDGLSWPRLASYRPWYEAGFKRLLAESQVETSCFYRHLNTETGPGHASLSTGAPPSVHGIVANRWFEANPGGVGLRRLYCTDQPDPSRVPGQPPLFYREVEKEGRIYVFARRRVLESWESSGEIGAQSTTRIGAGPNGETLIFDSDDAITLHALRHGLPAVDLPPSGTIPGPANLRIPTLGDRLVEASPGSRVVSLSGKDRGAIFLAGKNPRHVVYWYDRDTGRYVTSAAYDADGIVGSAARDLVPGGRLQSVDGGAETPYPNVQERLNRALSEALCLSPGSQPIYGIEGWTVAYDRSAFPARTVEGLCGEAGRTLTVADLDRVFPDVVRRLYGEEVEDVLLISQRDQWPADGEAVPFARNDFDLQRSGDAFLVPREHVLMHWDPERGSGHGSHHEYDTHVPALFWGAPFKARETDEACAPYDLAPTLADVLGLRLPDATGTSHAPRR